MGLTSTRRLCWIVAVLASSLLHGTVLILHVCICFYSWARWHVQLWVCLYCWGLLVCSSQHPERMKGTWHRASFWLTLMLCHFWALGHWKSTQHRFHGLFCFFCSPHFHSLSRVQGEFYYLAHHTELAQLSSTSWVSSSKATWPYSIFSP